MQLDMFGNPEGATVTCEWGQATVAVLEAPGACLEPPVPPVVSALLASPARPQGPGLSWRALCQDVDRLLAVDRWSYDLKDVAFVAECVRLGVLYRFGSPGGRAWRFIEDTSLGLADWLADEGVRFAQEYQGARHRFSDEELTAHWRCVLIQRARVQDCWDLTTEVHGKKRKDLGHDGI